MLEAGHHAIIVTKVSTDTSANRIDKRSGNIGKIKCLVLRGHSVIRTCGDLVLNVCLSVMNISTLMVNQILTIVVNNTYSQFLVS